MITYRARKKELNIPPPPPSPPHSSSANWEDLGHCRAGTHNCAHTDSRKFLHPSQQKKGTSVLHVTLRVFQSSRSLTLIKKKCLSIVSTNRSCEGPLTSELSGMIHAVNLSKMKQFSEVPFTFLYYLFFLQLKAQCQMHIAAAEVNCIDTCHMHIAALFNPPGACGGIFLPHGHIKRAMQ